VVDVKTAVVVLILPNIVMDGIQFARRGTPLSTVRRFWVLHCACRTGWISVDSTARCWASWRCWAPGC